MLIVLFISTTVLRFIYTTATTQTTTGPSATSSWPCRCCSRR